jgi:uncharacterized DUF497 family protein
MPPRKKFPAFRAHMETFTDIYSDPANRIAHERRRPFPAFSDADLLDWSDTLKRKDVEHSDQPPRFQALVAYRADYWRAFGGTGDPRVCFVVYCKINQRLKLISIRYANPEERQVFQNR